MKIKIIANPKKAWAVALSRELSKHITKKTKHKTTRASADATICVGGDGTILYANHQGRLEGAVLGIGSDKSYICQLHKDDWRRKIESMLDGPTQKIMTIECSIGPKKFVSVNDFVVHATHYRVAEMDVSIETGNGKRKTEFEGDGMIISSAVGSTGYAYSAGGKKLRPGDRKISVVPICPYKRMFGPKIIPEGGFVKITVGSDCAFITDGIFVRGLKKGETVTVKKGPDMIFFKGVGTWE